MPATKPSSSIKDLPKPPQKAALSTPPSKTGQTGLKTRLTIKYDCGFTNALTIRGSAAGLSWVKGIPLKNLSHDEWVFETLVPFTQCEYKILLNDTAYENGPNHILECGQENSCTPNFP